jgi:hypothetical protein
MGTDIHMIAQRRENADSPWVRVELSFPCQDCGQTGVSRYKNMVGEEVERPCYWCDGTGKCKTYMDRCYNLFSQLADVRNGYGFAGVDTGEGFVPICETKGLPEGIIDPDFDELGDHSFSWLTLAELESYDLDRVTVIRGIVDKNAYLNWDRKGPPDSWCGGISGDDIKIVTDVEARNGSEYTHVKVAWCRTYREAGGNFWKYVLPNLRELGQPDNVRIVFGFDS